jgi:hypothetical protein
LEKKKKKRESWNKKNEKVQKKGEKKRGMHCGLPL